MPETASVQPWLRVARSRRKKENATQATATGISESSVTGTDTALDQTLMLPSGPGQTRPRQTARRTDDPSEPSARPPA